MCRAYRFSYTYCGHSGAIQYRICKVLDCIEIGQIGEINECRGFCDDCLMHPNLSNWNQRIDDERNEPLPDFPEIARVYFIAAWDRINCRIPFEEIMLGFTGITNVAQRESLLDFWSLLMGCHFWCLGTEGAPQASPKERMVLIEMRRTLERDALSGLESIVPENQDRRAELLLEKVEISSLEHDERECSICSVAFGSPLNNGETEQPCRTKCHHLFGEGCIRQWLNRKPVSSCPNCRKEFENLDMLETAAEDPNDGIMPWWLQVMLGEGPWW